MKLFLGGGGSGRKIIDALNKFSSVINKNKPVLYIPLAMDYEKYDSCYSWFREEMKMINIHNFEMIRSSRELSKKDFCDYSALFIGGGNTFKLLNDLKQNDNFMKVKEYLKNGGVVFGGSAGTIIFGNNIACSSVDDENKVELLDTKGFNYLNDYSILCHLNNRNFYRNFEYLKRCSEKDKLVYLPEDDVIYVTDSSFSIIGKTRYIIFRNGQYFTHNTKKFEKFICI